MRGEKAGEERAGTHVKKLMLKILVLFKSFN